MSGSIRFDVSGTRPDIELSKLTTGHAANMYRWLQDPVVRQNVGIRREPSLEHTIQWITEARDDPEVSAFAVLVGGRHVGNVVLDRIDCYLSTARLSIYIGEIRSKGIGSAAVQLALDHAF